jgi:metallo-beta-lactamase family protein
MKITFWGAAETVTGSLHEVRAGGIHFILDCGLYQGRRKETRERNLNLPVEAASLDAVLLSHAHIDHSGNLPSLAKFGYQGPVYSTPATVDLCAAMLRDSAYIQEKDAEFLNKRRSRRKKLEAAGENGRIEPLYTIEDAERLLPLLRAVEYHTPTSLTNELTFETFDAGHMLGSSAIVLRERRNGREIRLAFSGDVGRKDLPIIRDPETLPPVDYLILESTYGGRLHEPEDAVKDRLAEVITRTSERGGKLIVPAFAVGRTQQIVLLVHELTLGKRIPRIPIYVDSPLAVNATEIYRKHPECYDREAREHFDNNRDPFGFGALRYVRDVAESKALNDLRYPAMIISASGMCEAGRILHHLRNNVEDPRNTILIPGFQAEHTLGRKIVERRAEVPIFGEPMRLRAEVVRLNALSGHADQQELLLWIKPLVPHLKKVFLVHGEPLQANALAEAIRELFGVSAVVAHRGDSVNLD